MAIEGVRDGDEIQVQRKREGEEDLEAQWQLPVPQACSAVLGTNCMTMKLGVETVGRQGDQSS
jgi:hypothetical protein